MTHLLHTIIDYITSRWLYSKQSEMDFLICAFSFLAAFNDANDSRRVAALCDNVVLRFKIVDPRRQSVEIGELAFERTASIVADLFECCGFGLPDYTHAVTGLKQPLDVDVDAMLWHHGREEGSVHV